MNKMPENLLFILFENLVNPVYRFCLCLPSSAQHSADHADDIINSRAVVITVKHAAEHSHQTGIAAAH